jgi:hypothetical protein
VEPTQLNSLGPGKLIGAGLGAWAKAIARLSGAARVLRRDDRTPCWKAARARICTQRLCLLFQSIARLAFSGSGCVWGKTSCMRRRRRRPDSPHAARTAERAKTVVALLSLGPPRVRVRGPKTRARSGVGGAAGAHCSLPQLSLSLQMYIPFGARFPAPAGACAPRRMSDCTFCQSDERVMLFSLPLAGAHASIKMGRAPLIKCDAGTRLLRDWLRIDFACECNRGDVLVVQVA